MIEPKIKKRYQIARLTLILLSFSVQTVFAQFKWFKYSAEPEKYSMYMDSSMRHDQAEAAAIKSINQDIQTFGTYMQSFKAEQYLGKRVRMTGYMKTKDVVKWAGFWFRVDQVNSQKPLAFDNMYGRELSKTTDWKKCEIILNVPSNASIIAFGGLLNGTGQIWFANVKFEVVDNSIPTTERKEQN